MSNLSIFLLSFKKINIFCTILLKECRCTIISVNIFYCLRQTNKSVLFEFMNYFHDFFELESHSQNKTSFDKEITHQLLHQEFPHVC